MGNVNQEIKMDGDNCCVWCDTNVPSLPPNTSLKFIPDSLHLLKFKKLQQLFLFYILYTGINQNDEG
jgi:hypothetical protein